ncbi:MAG: mechanosensitive ion channel protein [Phycisphaerae bacterium]|nr:mechanosensitive ion channel protein [Phycisphaerae bacterium]MDP6154494.1 mechanosensitive ion channel [Phycisphaeraceae bacterium]
METLKKIWEYELLKVAGESVQVSQVAAAIIVMIAGLLFARILTRAIGARVRRRAPQRVNVVAVLEKIVFDVLAIVIVLMAMNIAGIPIGIFAFLGGALAIGLGFGAQNLFNNFISGLIITFEQPMRIGDLIEVGDHLGNVKHVGARCTLIRRTDGIDVLVPNSYLLENALVNWTLSDQLMRTSVTVGIAYGSPTQTAAKLIRQAVEEQQDVLKDQEIIVIFDEFGDNALNFEVFFWTTTEREMLLRKLRSDIRYRIDDLFREAQIVIAFPQRDVHLDAAAPIDVRVVQS